MTPCDAKNCVSLSMARVKTFLQCGNTYRGASQYTENFQPDINFFLHTDDRKIYTSDEVLVEKDAFLSLGVGAGRVDQSIADRALEVKALRNAAAVEQILHHQQVRFVGGARVEAAVRHAEGAYDLAEQGRLPGFKASAQIGQVVRRHFQKQLSLVLGHFLQHESIV